MRHAAFRARRRDDAFELEGSPAALVGHVVPRDGGRRQDGAFVRWRFEDGRLVAENDRYGLVPLFYAARDGEIVVSSSLVELVRLGAPTELDELGLWTFRSLGFFLGEETPFRRVKVLPPGSRLVWDGRLLVEEQPRAVGSPLEIGREEACREYARRFREAVARRLEPGARVVLPLSGGRDSRHLLLALCELGRPPEACVSVRWFPPVGVDDAGIAALVAAQAGVPHRIVAQLARFEAEREKNERTHFQSDEHAWFVAVGRHLAAVADTTYLGLGGDILSASLVQAEASLRLVREGRLDQLADTVLARRAHERGSSPFTPPEDVRRLVHERVRGELERYREAPNPVTMFYFWTAFRREHTLIPYGLCPGVTAFCPFLDHDVVDFLSSLPPELTLDGRFHEETIAAAYPGSASLPYSRWSRRRRGVADWGPFALALARYGLRDGRRRPWARAVGRWLRFSADPRRWGHAHPADLEWLLYQWQLEDLAEGRLERFAPEAA